MKSNIDLEKPKLGPGEVLCSGCWAKTDDPKLDRWVDIGFHHLSGVTLCPDCQYRYQDEFEALRAAGL